MKGADQMSNQAASAIAQATVKVAAGEYDEAKRILEASLGVNPNHASLHEQLGLIAYQIGDFTEATAQLRQAIKLDASLDDARFTLLHIVTQGEDRVWAANLAAEALDTGVKSPRFLSLIAKAFKRNREFTKAGETWRHVAQYRSDAQPLLEATKVYLRAKDYKSAIECANTAAERDPASVPVKILQIQALDKSRADPTLLGKYVLELAVMNPSAALDQLPTLMANGLYEAIADLITKCKRQGISIDPILLSSIAKSLQNVARRSEAEQSFDKAGQYWKSLLEIEDDKRQAVRGLQSALKELTSQARNAMQAGKHIEASKLLRTILALDEADVRAWRDLGSALEKAEKWEDAAVTWLRHAATVSEVDRSAIALRAAKAARKVESPERQLSLFIQAQDVDPSGSKINEWGHRALVRSQKVILADIQKGEIVETVRHAIAARQWKGDQAKMELIERKLASVLRSKMVEADKLGDFAKSNDMARLMLKLDPAQVQALKLVARHAFRERSFHEAAELYNRLIELEPTEERHYAKLGRTYRNLRLFNKGIPIVTRLLELDPDYPQGRQLLSEMLLRQENQAAP